MAELYYGNKKVLGIKPPGEEYISLTFKEFNGYEITVPEGTTELPDEAFKDINAVTRIHLPDSLISIGKECFYGCRGLTHLVLPQNVTTLGVDCFDGCISLISINIPRRVASFRGADFVWCHKLRRLTIQGGSSTTVNEAYFCWPDSLKEIYFEGGPVTCTNRSFEGIYNPTFYYKADNPKWTSELRTDNYGGAQGVTWVAY